MRLRSNAVEGQHTIEVLEQLLAELRKIDKKGCRYNDIVNILKKFGRTASERK